jgi:hypothetical protein
LDSKRILRLSAVQSAVIEPIKKFIIRQNELQWLVISVFTHSKLTLYGRLALDSAVLDRIKIPGHSLDDVIKLRSETPTYDLILKEQDRQLELWNVFFTATWAEFECGVDDIRKAALEHNEPLAVELLGQNAHKFLSSRLGDQLQKIQNLSETNGFIRDIATYELLGFSPLKGDLLLTLAEANAIRNVLLHNRGNIDDKALRQCASLETIESPIRLNKDGYVRYSNATMNWASHLLNDLTLLKRR